MKPRVLRLSLVVTVVVGCSGCADELSSTFLDWSVEVLSPLTASRVPFCPAILVEPENSLLDGSFAPTAATTTLTNVGTEDEPLYTVETLRAVDQLVPLSPTFEALFSLLATFDVGPIGSVYDDTGTETLTWFQSNGLSPQPQSFAIERTLVGGSVKGDREVELSYEYVMPCETLKVVDSQGGEHSCECVDQTITYRFTTRA